jgi:hypothetical protein
MALNLYVLFQYIIGLIATALFLNREAQFDILQKIFVAILICIVVVNSGVLFEQRAWARYSEWVRIIAYPVLLIALTYLNGWSSLFYVIGILYLVVSTIWFYTIQKKNVAIQMA